MTSFVLDASAVLALLNKETGWEKVEAALPNSIISTINLCEVATVLESIGIPSPKVREAIYPLLRTVVPFSEEQAYICAGLRKITKDLGLSLGDRACISLAQMKKCPALTADKAWSKLDGNIEIILIR